MLRNRINRVVLICAALSGWHGIASAQIEWSPNRPEAQSEHRIKPLSEIRLDAPGVERDGYNVPALQLLPASSDAAMPVSLTEFNWCSSNLRYRRPYFEELLLERHGLTPDPILQPLWSGVRFYATAPLLPFLKVARPPWQTYDHRAFGTPGSPLVH
jgi:hypothetical protein